MVLAAVLALALQGQTGQANLEGRALYDYAIGAPTGRNGYEEFVEAASLIANKGYLAFSNDMPQVGDKNWLTRRRQVCDASLKSLDLVHNGVSKDVFSPNGDVSHVDNAPEAVHFVNLARALVYRATVACADGKPDLAAGVLADGILFATKISQSAGRQHWILGGYLLYDVFQEFEQDRKQLTPMGLRTVENALDAALVARNLDRVIDQENMLVAERLKPFVLDPLSPYKSNGLQVPETGPAKDWLNMSPAQRRVEADAFLQGQKARGDHYKSVLRLPEAEWKKDNYSGPALEGSALKIFQPDWDMPMLGEAEVHTILRLGRLHCKILEHKWHFGSLPTELAVFADIKAATDPQTGKKFVYHTDGKGYELWAESEDGSEKTDVKSHRYGLESGAVDPPNKAEKEKRT